MVYFFTLTYTPPPPSKGGGCSDYYVNNNDDDFGRIDPFVVHEQLPSIEYQVYMGKDKFENELLIKYGLDTDVWFHVDNLSSAHVYLRMKDGMVLDDIPQSVITDCAALCKANSIAGCKKASVDIVYTRWKNLKKTSDMVEGQVGYHRPSNVRRIKVEKLNDRVKALNKTRIEKQLSEEELYQLQQEYHREIQRQKKKHHQEQAKLKQQQQLKQQQEKEARSYDRLYDTAYLTSVSDQNATADSSAAEAYEDDFF
ncbi:fibronectin-binding protein [Nitzschia inconspicua]|uniref:Fibronectin-binding protein n=1 Tax=Nitzschia inconspicua TaxID=303405 RepID=A0A9K3Q8B1_9STRA|nr:fibronectin-binding protein [Nitzschia inconspicua]